MEQTMMMISSRRRVSVAIYTRFVYYLYDVMEKSASGPTQDKSRQDKIYRSSSTTTPSIKLPGQFFILRKMTMGDGPRGSLISGAAHYYIICRRE